MPGYVICNASALVECCAKGGVLRVEDRVGWKGLEIVLQ